jgi:hypothetical protein
MAESRTEQGRQWVSRTFDQIKAEYPQISVERVYPWRVGDNFDKSHEKGSSMLNFDLGPNYFLSFDMNGTNYYIEFTKRQLDDCVNPRNVKTQDEIKRVIRERFGSLI